MTIPVQLVAEEIARRQSQRMRGDLTAPTSFSLTALLSGRLTAAADWCGVTRSALVQLLLEDAMDDFAGQFEHGYVQTEEEES